MTETDFSVEPMGNVSSRRWSEPGFLKELTGRTSQEREQNVHPPKTPMCRSLLDTVRGSAGKLEIVNEMYWVRFGTQK